MKFLSFADRETNMGCRKVCLPGLESLSSMKSLFSQELDVSCTILKSQSLMFFHPFVHLLNKCLLRANKDELIASLNKASSVTILNEQQIQSRMLLVWFKSEI